MTKEIPFFNMPASVFAHLKERIAETSEDEVVAKDALRALGNSWAADSVTSLGLTSTWEELSYNLQQFCIQMGVLKVDVVIAGSSAIEVTVRETDIEDVDFLLGFVAGAVSGLLATDHRIVISDEEGPTFFLSPAYMGLPSREVELEEASGDGSDRFDDGEAYLISDTNQAEAGFELAVEALISGREVYCISRVFPPKARNKNPLLKGTKMAWLSDTTVKSGSEDFDIFSPKRPDFELSRSLMDFFKNHERGLVMIHGIEYLISQTDFSTIEKFLQKMKDVAVTNRSVILCPVNPNALGIDNYAKLVTEFTELKLD